MKQNADPFKKPQIIGQRNYRKVGDIDALYTSVPQTEPVIADYQVDFVFTDDPFKSKMFRRDMVKQER